MRAVVTGGCGFIGSHLVDALAGQGEEVAVIDNLSTGNLGNLAASLPTGRCTFHHMDLNGEGWERVLEGAGTVWHLAADPDVRMSGLQPEPVVRNNILATARVLEAMRRQDVPRLVFTSTSTVYGEASVIPTPEDYTPLEPISVYAGSKLACEALISAYCHSYGMQAWVFRFANIIGERSNHGVICDFVRKLGENPRSLEILGDGRQSKSYLEVRECVKAMLHAVEHAKGPCNVFNIGSEDWIDVKGIADIVVAALGLFGVEYRFTGGNRGWVGDVPRMLLSVDRLKALGWKPGMGSRESVEAAARAMAGGRR
ncbi:MAG TPA: NAD-dependent epimerase/dehydratase family protein [Methanomicrobiales archaeon]|jgi:UDP-glucose 4-epimerase|nr:NAD-dependent epimerase/dehydratase family protein [Methanomicrobiales archaeon]